jgi:hypothetical protein
MYRQPLAAIVVLILSSMAYAQCVDGMCPVAPTAQPAVARIVNQKQDGRYLGSGTLVEKDDARGLIVTCAHLFRDGAGRVTVAFADGRVFDANVLATDQQWDLAALEIAPPAASPVEIAAEAPQPGEWLQSCGYGADGRYRCNQGQARGYVQAVGTGGPETLELSGAARQGDSGGPVFNRRGQLAAVLWGTDGRTVGGTYCVRVRTFLAGVLRCRRTPIAEPRVTEKPVATDKTGTGTSPSPSDAGDNVNRGSEPVPVSFRQLDEHLRQIRGRLEKIESAASVAEKLDHDKVRAIARAVAADALADGASSASRAWLPALMAALGWTGPPALAAMFALRLAGMMLRRRLTKASQQPMTTASSTKPLNDDYAQQLAEVYALSGRSATADATLGREYDEELTRAQQSSDAALAAWAKRVRETVANKFYRIHSESPSPVEPVSQRQEG